MNNSDLVSALAESLDMSQAETRRLLDTVVTIFKDNLAKDVSFTVPELGTFDTRTRKQRKAFNPHYRKYMMLPPKRVVDFRPSKGLKEDLKEIEL